MIYVKNNLNVCESFKTVDKLNVSLNKAIVIYAADKVQYSAKYEYRYVCAVYVAFFWCVTIPSLCTIFHWAKIEILYIVEYIFNAIAHNCVIKINIFYFVNCKFLIYDECYRLFHIKWIAANLSPIYFSDGVVEKYQSILNNVDSSIKKFLSFFSLKLELEKTSMAPSMYRIFIRKSYTIWFEHWACALTIEKINSLFLVKLRGNFRYTPVQTKLPVHRYKHFLLKEKREEKELLGYENKCAGCSKCDPTICICAHLKCSMEIYYWIMCFKNTLTLSVVFFFLFLLFIYSSHYFC